jgi:hypothetical protein
MLASSSSDRSTRGVLYTGSFTTEYFGGETLYDVLRRRAPQYLHPRPTPGAELTGRSDPLAIYIDGNFAGSADVLQLIPAYTVFSVDRISSSEAAIKFGPKHSNGALLVHWFFATDVVNRRRSPRPQPTKQNRPSSHGSGRFCCRRYDHGIRCIRDCSCSRYVRLNLSCRPSRRITT